MRPGDGAGLLAVPFEQPAKARTAKVSIKGRRMARGAGIGAAIGSVNTDSGVARVFRWFGRAVFRSAQD